MGNRQAGVLLPLSALPSSSGMGSMGAPARRFLKWLKAAGFCLWQILPMGPTGYGDSPYQSFSSFAGNPYWIDVDDLFLEGWIDVPTLDALNRLPKEGPVRYDLLYRERLKLLEQAAQRVFASLHQKKGASPLSEPQQALLDWLQEAPEELRDYALFMAIKKAQNGRAWTDWDAPLRLRDPEALAAFQAAHQEAYFIQLILQFWFETQWSKLRELAHELELEIIGDLPIYCAYDSADVWARQDLFALDETGRPEWISGVPPDGFSPIGQVWGNPLFDWARHRQENYSWWQARIKAQLARVDVLRIDHFRGFEAFFAIPYGASSAAQGHWEQGPGLAFFKTIESTMGSLPLIAEDLGFLTQGVRDLLSGTGFPGMKVLQMAFDPRDTGGGYLPHEYERHCVAYTGTHDNDTSLGWFESAPEEARQMASAYLGLKEELELLDRMRRTLLMSVADRVIFPVQDLLDYGSEARINTPSTAANNWTWRMSEADQKRLEEAAPDWKKQLQLYDRFKKEARD